MADFSDIIQEINTNLPDNTSQAITSAKLRTTLIDLTEKIDNVQDDFEAEVSSDISNKLDKITYRYEYTPVEASYSSNFYVSLTNIWTNDGFRSSFFPVTPGQIYQIIGRYGTGTGSYLYAFSNDGSTMTGNGHFQVTDETKGQIVQKNVTIPSGVTHIIVTWYGTEPGAECNLVTEGTETFLVVEQIEENTQNISTLTTSVENKADKDVTIFSEIGVEVAADQVINGYIGNTSIISNSNYRTSMFPVTEGYKYLIKGSYGSGTGTRLFATYSNGSIVERYLIGGEDGIKKYRDYVFTIPEGLNIDHLAIQWGVVARPVAQCFEYTPVVSDLGKTSENSIDFINSRKTFNMLCLGNSFTQDTISYVPYMLAEAEPDMDINVYFVYYAGAPLAQYVAYVENTTVTMTGPSEDNINITYANNGGQCTVTTNGGTPSTASYILYYCNIKANEKDSFNNRWHSVTGKSFEEVIGLQKWNLITVQQAGQYNYRDYDYYFKPFITRLSYDLLAKTGYSCKLGYIMTHASYSTYTSTLNTRYAGLAANAQRVMNETPIEVLLPYATAVQNARTTFLDDYGNEGHMSNDHIHLVDGVGCLTAAVANAQAILEHIQSSRTVLGSQIMPGSTWLTTYNIPGRSSSVGMTYYNASLCQQCAIIAYKKPFETTNMVNIGLANTYEIYIPYSTTYKSANPICSANEGDTWSSKIVPVNNNITITNVTATMNDTALSNVWDSETQTLTIPNVTGRVEVSVTTEG